MLENKKEVLEALSKANSDTEAYHTVESLINKYFAMIEHMKQTSLYDVYMYEERLAKGVAEPLSILAYENERLKKEVNGLRRQLGEIEKYKE